MRTLMFHLRREPKKGFLTLVMFLLSIAFLFPLFWMISAAFKTEVEVLSFPIKWIPEKSNFWNNFHTVWLSDVPFHLFYLNSIKLAIITTLATLLFSTMAAYSFSKLRFPGKNIIFFLLVSFMIIPEQATLVPRYILIKWMGLYNTHAAIVFMVMFSIYFTFLMRQFMLSISNEFIEAAKIDGAGYFRIYWQIMLPLSKPIIATAGIIKFIWTWNDYEKPLIFLYDQKLYPIPLGIQLFKEQFSNNYAVSMMAALSAIIPILIVFVLLQRQVINGIALGGVKG